MLPKARCFSACACSSCPAPPEKIWTASQSRAPFSFERLSFLSSRCSLAHSRSPGTQLLLLAHGRLHSQLQSHAEARLMAASCSFSRSLSHTAQVKSENRSLYLEKCIQTMRTFLSSVQLLICDGVGWDWGISHSEKLSLTAFKGTSRCRFGRIWLI